MPDFRLSATAQDDIVGVLAYTEERFGSIARRRYEALFVVGLRDLAANPMCLGSIARPELGRSMRSYHLRHSRNRARTPDGVVRLPRHFLLYRTMRPDLIGIGRVLHDGMEMEAHLPDQYGDE